MCFKPSHGNRKNHSACAVSVKRVPGESGHSPGTNQTKPKDKQAGRQIHRPVDKQTNNKTRFENTTVL